jgi:hypothetical protein
MAATIKGLGVVWSVGTITMAGGVITESVGGTNHMTQSLSFERNSEVARIKETGGEIKTVVFSGFTKTLRISVVPAGSTLANAATSSENLLPKPGDKISITDTISSGTGKLDTNFYVISATQNRTVDGAATIDLVLENSDESDLSTSV